MSEQIPPGILEAHPELEWAVLITHRGSIAHGTHVPSDDPNSFDDIDAIGICVPPLDYYFGLRAFGSRGTVEIKEDPWDIVLYEHRKALRMLARGNPNILGMLWVDPEMVIHRSTAGQMLIEHRHLFATKESFKPFRGYAQDQMRKMEYPGKFLGYMGPKRRALVERFGYDTKMAAHLIRLLRMGSEFLDTGRMNVRREDAEELKAIKRGDWKLKDVKAEAQRWERAIVDAYERSTLPESPDWDRINRLAILVAQTR